MEYRLDYFLDPNFRFDESAHVYSYLDPNTGKPVQQFKSVTGFISQFKKKFDSDFWSKKKAAQLGKTPDQVLEQWKEKSETAMSLGTDVHKWIENFYDGTNPPDPEHPEVFSRVMKFKQLHEEKLHKFTPVKQEFRIFSRKWGLAGTMDALFRLSDKYYIGDWKTNSKFTTDLHPKGKYQKLLWPFEDLWDNSLNGYSIQISLYRLILEEEAGFVTNGGFLTWIGPDGKPELHKTVDLRDRLREFLEKEDLKF